MSKIEFHCVSCGWLMKVPFEYAGRTGACPKCKTRQVVPTPDRAIPSLESATAIPDVGPTATRDPQADERRIKQLEAAIAEQQRLAAIEAKEAELIRLAERRQRQMEKEAMKLEKESKRRLREIEREIDNQLAEARAEQNAGCLVSLITLPFRILGWVFGLILVVLSWGILILVIYLIWSAVNSDPATPTQPPASNPPIVSEPDSSNG